MTDRGSRVVEVSWVMEVQPDLDSNEIVVVQMTPLKIDPTIWSGESRVQIRDRLMDALSNRMVKQVSCRHDDLEAAVSAIHAHNCAPNKKKPSG